MFGRFYFGEAYFGEGSGLPSPLVYIYSNVLGPVLAAGALSLPRFDRSHPTLSAFSSGPSFGLKLSGWYSGGLYGQGLYGDGGGILTIGGVFDTTNAILAAFDRPEPALT